jgi:pimeloyl-ACP methyl ester carboxylesterase
MNKKCLLAHASRSRFLLPLLASILLSGCAFIGSPQPRIPTELIAAPLKSPSKRLVIVLPGLGDDLRAMRNGGIVKAVQTGMPDADVLLVELKFPYYRRGRAIPRLHNEIVIPARRRGYQEITLAGASLGGMGALLYEHNYPGQMQHLVLMAPYMGSRSVLTEIDAAGGLSAWEPGRLPIDPEIWAAGRIEWHLIKSWLQDRNRAADIWLVCGDDDRFIKAARTIEPVLLERNYVELVGGHKWTVWTRGAQEVFARISSDRIDESPLQRTVQQAASTPTDDDQPQAASARNEGDARQ